ncbi:radical SAM protein [Nocardia sp. NPDC050175]|uniref:radical SAM protein n=1 Tax=Nocardia sp. NPDC050175 TaxID=3364317 RepID=UPI0037A9FCEF
MAIPLDVHLYVTPRCNLSCPHCYYDALERGRQPDNVLSLAEVSRVLNGLCERFDADISLEGGEPFMRAGLGKMLSTLDAAVLSRITVTTNGTVRMLASTTVLAALGDLRVSIDGHTDDLQQELRGVNVAPVLDTCTKLRSQGIPHTVRMTLYRRNIRRLGEIFVWAEANEVARLSLFEYQASGRGIGQDALFSASAEDVDCLLDDFTALPRPAGLKVVTLNLARRRMAAVQGREGALAEAGIKVRWLPAVANCTVNYDGTVGISPWKVTAHGAPDIFTHTTAPDFFDQLEASAVSGGLSDDGDCISRVQLRCDR